MSIPRTMTVNCSKCGEPITTTVFESVNTDYSPDIAQQIMQGKFFVVECPKCKNVSSLEYDVLYHDIKHSAMIWVLQKNTPDYEKKLNEIRNLQTPTHKTLRIVGDMDELRGKVFCLENNRDDRVIELCKMFTAINLMSENPDFEIMAVYYAAFGGTERIYFYDKNAESTYCNLTEKIYEYIKNKFYNSKFYNEFDNNYAIIDCKWAEKNFYSIMGCEDDEKPIGFIDAIKKFFKNLLK